MTELRTLLGIADYRRLWTAQLVSDVGDSLTLFSLLFLVQRLTGDEAAVASVLIAAALPALLVGLMAGVWVDRWNLKRTMIASDLVRACLVLVLVLVDDPSDVWMLYGVVFLQSSAATFFRPARQALIPRIVGAELLLSANSVGEVTRVVGYALGTAAAGLAVGLGGAFAPIFVADAVTFVLSALLVVAVATPGDPLPSEDGSVTGVWRELSDGIGLMVRSRWLSGVLVGATLAMFGLGAVNGLIVPFVVGELGLSESWFGLLEGAQSAGVIVAGSLVAALSTRFRPTFLLAGGLAAVGVVVAAFSLANGVLALTGLMLAVGLAVAPVQASATTILQREAPPRLLGRAAAALSAGSTSAQVASLAVAGSLAALVGVRSVFVVAGGVAVAAGAVSWTLFRTAPTTADADLEPV